MIVIIGLVIVIAAAGVATAGVAANTGGAHSSGSSFVLFGQSITGLSTGQLFLFGIIVGVVGMLGLAMLLGTFNRRMASRRSRRELKGSRREGAALRVDRDRLSQELNDVRRDNLHIDETDAGTVTDTTVTDTTVIGATDTGTTDTGKTPVAVDAGRAGRIDQQAAGDSADRSTAQEPGHARRSGIWHRFDRVGR